MDYADKQETLARVFGVVEAYDDELGLFVVAPDRLGIGFLSPPLPYIDQQVVDSLQALLNHPFPVGTIVQFTLYSSPDIELTIHKFLSLRNRLEPGAVRSAIENRVEFLRHMTETPVGTAAPARLRDVQMLITIQVPSGGVAPNDAKKAELREMRQNVNAMLEGMKFAPSMLTAEDYLRFMETVINQGPDAAWRKSPLGEHDESVLICNQILDGNNAISHYPDKLHLGRDAVVRVISPKRLPKLMYPGQGFTYLADLANGAKASRDPVLITLNVLYPDSDKRRAEIQRDHMWNTQQKDGKLAKIIPDFAIKQVSLDIAMRDMNNGDRPLYAYIGAATICQNEERSIQATTDLISMFRGLGITMVEDRYFVLPLFSQLLPFGASEDIKMALTRYRTLMSRQIVTMLPVFGSWRGTGTPLMTFVARDGQLMAVSPWDTNAGFNIIIAAQTGAGKSFLANFFVENVLSVGGRAWIVDQGGSYKQTCEALEGQYIEFSDDADLSMNPFSHVQNFVEESDLIAGMIEVMAAPRNGFDDYEVAEVRRVLQEVWNAKGHTMLIDDLRDALAAVQDDDKNRLKDIAKQLYPFTKEGPYGRYFDRPNTINMNNKLVVLELQDLKSRPHLQRLVLLQIMNQIQQGMMTSPADQKKLVLIDEAFALLASDETMNFIVGWYRQLRKAGGCAAIATQSVSDLFVNRGAVAIMENSAHRYLLMQKGESIDRAREAGELAIGDNGFKMLATVKTVQGQYSEIFLDTPYGRGIGRLIVSPYSMLMYSSKAEDKTAIRSYREQGLTLEQSINQVLADRRTSDVSGLN